MLRSTALRSRGRQITGKLQSVTSRKHGNYDVTFFELRADEKKKKTDNLYRREYSRKSRLIDVAVFSKLVLGKRYVKAANR